MYQQIAANKRRSVAYVVAVFVVWVGLGAALGWLAASTGATAPGKAEPVAADAVTGMVIAGVLALGAIVFALVSGARLVLAVSGAVPADPVRYAPLHHVVEALAIGDGIPKPAVYVIDDPSPNAFATGTSPSRAAITATTGLLELMDREELEGVIGHEVSHIKNYDVRLLLIVSTLVGLAGLLASFVWRSIYFMTPRRRGDGQTTLVVVAGAAVLALVSVVVGPVLRLAVSRRREELADVSGVELTRNPAGLISALHKLEGNDEPFAKLNHATAPMCIDDPLQHHGSWFHRLYDTHPPISERIAVLERIEQGQSV